MLLSLLIIHLILIFIGAANHKRLNLALHAVYLTICSTLEYEIVHLRQEK